jgi:hypothetical protein
LLKATVAAAALLLAPNLARADSTVAAMTAAGALAGPELFYCVQTAADRNCTATQLKTFVTSSGVVTSVGFSVPATSIFTATGSPVTGSGTLGFTTAGTSGGIPYFSSAAALSSSAVLTANLPVIGGGAGVAPTVGTVSGNTTKFATVSATFVTGQCVQVDASLNLTTTGSACGAGGGGTTIGTTTITGGTSGNFLYNNAGVYGERTPAQTTAVLTPFSTSTTAQGVVPGSNGAAATSFLNATGAWSVPAGSGGLPLVGTGLTYTTNTPLLDLSQTWNGSGVTFQAIRLNVTNTLSAAASLLMDLQVGGSTSVSATTDGWITFPNNLANNLHFGIGNKNGALAVSNGSVTLQIFGNEVYISGTPPTLSFADNAFIVQEGASNVLAQRNGANAQTFRVYNTFTDASNYERGVMDWTTTANTLTIGTQQLGTGQARQVNIAAPLHLGYTSGTPTANSCAGFALTTGSSDVAGKVTFTSATACSITFANAFTNAPFCVVSPGSAASTHDAVTSTTGLAVTFGTANTSMQWHCFGS